MLIDRLIKEVKIELSEAYKLLDELDPKNEERNQKQTDFSNEEVLVETTKEIIGDHKDLLSNLKTDELATIISKIEEKYTVCPSCERDLAENDRLIRLPYQSLVHIKSEPIPPMEIAILNICPYCNYILDFKFFKGNEAWQLYKLLIDDLSETKFELEQGVKV